MGPLVSIVHCRSMDATYQVLRLTLMIRAGGPGDSKEDVKWLDEKLKIFLADGTFP